MLPLLIPTLALLQIGGAGAQVGRGPEPSPRPISWELTFTFHDPQRIDVQLPGQDEPETYWYLVYTVTNNTGRSRRFFPTFEIVTEALEVHPTDTGISPLVFEAIQERHRITHKYLVMPSKAIGALLTGEDNARESVAIWRNIDLSNNEFRVYVAGLSGETLLLPNPAFDPEQPETGVSQSRSDIAPGVAPATTRPANPRYFTLRKTLEIGYNLPGSPIARPAVQPERSGVRWIMR